jgi:hypothetical protein
MSDIEIGSGSGQIGLSVIAVVAALVIAVLWFLSLRKP